MEGFGEETIYCVALFTWPQEAVPPTGALRMRTEERERGNLCVHVVCCTLCTFRPHICSFAKCLDDLCQDLNCRFRLVFECPHKASRLPHILTRISCKCCLFSLRVIGSAAPRAFWSRNLIGQAPTSVCTPFLLCFRLYNSFL